ncbi:DNA polymerase III subunit gamma/tau [Lactobacillus sp. W8089]|nr:DNA polymerase III subunit gamma/tau [Lactobacillus sp. W8086]MBI0108166.1 DNA polymerase III subunit gamma/tau [Lactobacillus sp. W8085]MBI0111384.1 DNA polymerase III subunit gamma/tau [Lactobacillus sp. W8088]MBI0115099.1 DNA polymerase III subunit gamma/tau [Lactobacillus sp. W8087]MBI0118824.1 DNA polymerase III subunit gamma/tau [Lactobacillus sp. W8089]MBI0130789.1 DNA polymerase III subunit gamma/tau [Lactobacillus sp. W8090]
MAYQALYRVWRPQTFGDVIGQDAITTTLRNAVATKQVSHAYLFTGPRGTGKTSCSKILAKAVNCLQPQKGEPCNQCEICQAINANSLNDVIEIDAASNNGVEQIRDIRDKVKYAPTRAAYKVYIIDEVHMLSTGAFNALLKTLEEPPAQVIFILATTEPQKIPATIISRTQRFDFRRITASTILERLEFILKAKQVPYDEQGLKLIAQAAEGGMRDALSILDQALSLDNKRLTLDNAIQVTGTVDKKQLEAYFLAIIAANAAQALEDLHQLLASGRSPHRFIEAIIETCRDLLLIKTDDKLLDDFSRSLISPQIVAAHDQISQQQLYQMINAASQTQQDLHNVSRTDIYLEVLTVKLCEIMQSTNSEESTASLSKTLQDLQSEVKQLKQNMADLQKKIAKAPQATSSPKIAPAKSFKSATGHTHVDQQKINQILANATRKALNQVREVWPDLMSMLNVTQKAVMKVSKPVAASSAGVVVAFDYAMWFERVMSNQELLEILKNNLDKLLHNDADVVIVAAENWPQIRQTFLQNHEITNSSAADVKKTKSTNVAVDKAQKLFGTELVELKKD